MRIFYRLTVVASVVFALTACEDGDSGGSESSVEDSGSCRKFKLNIVPINYPINYCGAPGTATVGVINNLNGFWGGSVQACSLPGSNNGLVYNNDPARIYYDPNLLGAWDNYYNSSLPGDIFMAHEYGHVVQNKLQLGNPYKELQADCLAGYYMGSRSCAGDISESDLIATYSNFCAIGDTAGATAWWDTSNHGTCSQRMSNVQKGFDGYLNRLLPGQACP